ncbi:MAG: acetolactate synthase small subunit [Lentisphaeraceae bacterium]|nr:acetolactate synthase small subunit [Lentisphaeraceae bacterium]
MINENHTISILVVNKPGVLMRVAQVFSRRGFNIDSLVVSSGFDNKYARMTITAQGNEENLDQINMQLSKLVDVMHCIEHENVDSIIKEMALIKVACKVAQRSEVLQLVEHFACKTVDMTKESMVIQATGNSDKLDALIDQLSEYTIIELVRTGKVLMARGQEET